MDSSSRVRCVSLTLLVFAALASSRGAAQSTPDDLLSHVRAAHGDFSASTTIESVGTLVRYGPDGSKHIFNVRLLQRGSREVLRVISNGVREGTDGSRKWTSTPLGEQEAAGPALNFIDSFSSKSVAQLVQSDATDLSVLPAQDNMRRIDHVSGARYLVDRQTGLVRSLESSAGEAKDAVSGASIEIINRYLFDDYRRVERGRQMPFHIIHSVNGRIVDEMVFDSVTATEGVSVDTFRP